MPAPGHTKKLMPHRHTTLTMRFRHGNTSIAQTNSQGPFCLFLKYARPAAQRQYQHQGGENDIHWLALTR